METIKQSFQHDRSAPNVDKRAIIIVGVVETLDKAPEVYALLCRHMKNRDSKWFITYMDVVTCVKAVGKRIALPVTKNFPYFLVLDNPYDNTIDYTKPLLQTDSVEDLEKFLTQL